MTQGRGDGKEWVTSFMVSYSRLIASQWQYVTDRYGNRKVSSLTTYTSPIGSVVI